MGVGTVATAVKSAIEAAKYVKDINDQTQLNHAMSEVMEKLATAQSELVTVLDQQQDLVEENRRLREELAKEKQFEQYRLDRTPMGDHIMPLKEEYVTEDRVAHAICVVCRGDRKAVPLTERQQFYRCPVCKTTSWKEKPPTVNAKRRRTSRGVDL